MIEIAGFVREGAKAYLKQQFKVVIFFFIIIILQPFLLLLFHLKVSLLSFAMAMRSRAALELIWRGRGIC